MTAGAEQGDVSVFERENRDTGEAAAGGRQVGANPRAVYYPALDGIRAAAVLLVFAGHYMGLTPGWMGVDIFFVLSGFLITGILYEARDGVARFKNFYMRRTLRIFPLYYAVWAVLFVLTPILHIRWRLLNMLWVVYLGNLIPLAHQQFVADPGLDQIRFFLHSALYPALIYVGHFWSLCVEEQFYLVWPLVVFTVRRYRPLLRICLGVVVLSPLVRCAIVHLGPIGFTSDGALGSLTFLRLDEFLMGGWGALVLKGENRNRLLSVAGVLFYAALAVLVVVYLYSHYVLHSQTNWIIDRSWVFTYGVTLVDVTALGWILLCVKKTNYVARVMNLAPLRALGRISYGFYVFHDLPHHFYNAINAKLGVRSSALGMVVPLIGTLTVSVLSYRFLESPFLRLKTRFESPAASR